MTDRDEEGDTDKEGDRDNDRKNDGNKGRNKDGNSESNMGYRGERKERQVKMKRDVTDWTQKGNQKITRASGAPEKGGFKQAAGKAGLLMCAAAIIAVLAKAVKGGGLEEYQESDGNSDGDRD